MSSIGRASQKLRLGLPVLAAGALLVGCTPESERLPSYTGYQFVYEEQYCPKPPTEIEDTAIRDHYIQEYMELDQNLRVAGDVGLAVLSISCNIHPEQEGDMYVQAVNGTAVAPAEGGRGECLLQGVSQLEYLSDGLQEPGQDWLLGGTVGEAAFLQTGTAVQERVDSGQELQHELVFICPDGEIPRNKYGARGA